MLSSTLMPPDADVLVVDDNATVLKALRKAFGRIKPELRIHQSQSPEEAEGKININQYKILFIDLIMKNQETAGLELIEKIATKTQGIIVLYTSFECSAEVQRRIEKISERYPNFSLFIREKDDSYQSLREILTYYVNLDPDLPLAFLDLIRELEGDIQATKNRQVFEQGKIYAKGLERLEMLRKELKDEIERLAEKKENSPRREHLQRQYDKIKGDWYQVLAKYLPNAPTAITLWTYYRYYQEFKNPELFPHIDKVKITQFQHLSTLLNFSSPIEADSSEIKERKNILNAQEKAFFDDLIKNTPREVLSVLLKIKNLKNYLTIRKELWEEEADIPPEFVFRLATQYTTVGAKAHLPNLINAWQEGGVKQLQEMIPPINVMGSSVEKLKQLQQSLKETKSSSPVWQVKTYYQLFKGNFSEALLQLGQSSFIIVLDYALAKRPLINIYKQLIDGSKNGDQYEILAISTIDLSRYQKIDYENFWLQSPEILEIQRLPHGKVVIITQSSCVEKLEALIQQWHQELAQALETTLPEQLEDDFLQIVQKIIKPEHFFLINLP